MQMRAPLKEVCCVAAAREEVGVGGGGPSGVQWHVEAPELLWDFIDWPPPLSYRR